MGGLIDFERSLFSFFTPLLSFFLARSCDSHELLCFISDVQYLLLLFSYLLSFLGSMSCGGYDWYRWALGGV